MIWKTTSNSVRWLYFGEYIDDSQSNVDKRNFSFRVSVLQKKLSLYKDQHMVILMFALLDHHSNASISSIITEKPLLKRIT